MAVSNPWTVTLSRYKRSGPLSIPAENAICESQISDRGIRYSLNGKTVKSCGMWERARLVRRALCPGPFYIPYLVLQLWNCEMKFCNDCFCSSFSFYIVWWGTRMGIVYDYKRQRQGAVQNRQRVSVKHFFSPAIAIKQKSNFQNIFLMNCLKTFFE